MSGALGGVGRKLVEGVDAADGRHRVALLCAQRVLNIVGFFQI